MGLTPFLQITLTDGSSNSILSMPFYVKGQVNNSSFYLFKTHEFGSTELNTVKNCKYSKYLLYSKKVLKCNLLLRTAYF